MVAGWPLRHSIAARIDDYYADERYYSSFSFALLAVIFTIRLRCHIDFAAFSFTREAAALLRRQPIRRHYFADAFDINAFR